MDRRVIEIREIAAPSQQELLEEMDMMHNRGWEEIGKQQTNIVTDPATGEKRMVYSLTIALYSYES
jgi:hypothetical protein